MADYSFTAFADELEKIAVTKWDAFLRKAPKEDIAEAVSRFMGSVQPSYWGSTFKLNRALKAARSGEGLKREELVKQLRVRASAPVRDEMDKAVLEHVKPNLTFARTLKQRIESPTVKVLHGGTEQELQQALKHGPSGVIPPVAGATGKPEDFGMFFHKTTDSLADRVRDGYAGRRASLVGGDPAVLEAEIPSGLLQQAGRLGGGEHVVPASLWKYLQNAKITKVKADG